MRLIIGFLLAVLVLQARAEAASEQGVSSRKYVSDLMQLYRESRLEDPRILSAYAQAQAGKDRQREAFGALLPQVSAGASINRNRRKSQGLPHSYYNNERYNISLTQHIYNKAAWEHYQKFKSLASQGVSEAENTLGEATTDLAQRYFAALAADDELALVMAERRATQENLERVKALYKKQMAMVTDVLDLQARVDALAAAEVEARNQVRLSRQELTELIGRPVKEQLSRVREDIALQVPAEELDVWVDRALASNPALKARESALLASNAALREGKGGHYPSVSFNLSGLRSNVGYDNSMISRYDNYVASIGVQVPIYSGGSTSARVRALYGDQTTAEQELEAMRRQVVKETTNAYLTAQASVEKVRASRKALESAEKATSASERGFQYGVVNSVDVLTSVQNAYKARRDLLKAQYDFITNLMVLNRWAGALSEQTVESVNVWLARGEEAEARALERKTTE